MYFIGGLGCTPLYPVEFFQELREQVTYLDPYHVELTSLEELKNWFAKQIDLSEDIILLAHSLGADLAVYLANHFPQVRKLVLLDGGYVDMEAICSLEEELAGVRDHLDQYSFATIEEAIELEKSRSHRWSNQLEKAVRAGLVWDEEERIWKLNLSYENIARLLTLR